MSVPLNIAMDMNNVMLHDPRAVKWKWSTDVSTLQGDEVEVIHPLTMFRPLCQPFILRMNDCQCQQVDE